MTHYRRIVSEAFHIRAGLNLPMSRLPLNDMLLAVPWRASGKGGGGGGGVGRGGRMLHKDCNVDIMSSMDSQGVMTPFPSRWQNEAPYLREA